MNPTENPLAAAAGAGEVALPRDVDTTVAIDVPRSGNGTRVPLSVRLIRLFFRAVGAAAPRVAAYLGERMFYIPPPYHMPRREREWMRQAVREDLPLAGHNVATYRWGDTGPTVVLVHGWGGRASQMGSLVAPLVSAGFRVAAFDAPAHGATPGRKTNGFAIADVLADFAARQESLYGVVAHSFGAICVLIAMRRGVSVERAAMISPGVEGNTLFRGFGEKIGLPERARVELRRRVIARFGEDRWRQFGTREEGATLGSCAKGVLLAHDVDDREVPWAETVELARWTANARLCTTKGLGHRRILRHERMLERVTRFMAGRGEDAEPDATGSGQTPTA
jgi:pimeloyl-ACP methyl ester carboxylesterase